MGGGVRRTVTASANNPMCSLGYRRGRCIRLGRTLAAAFLLVSLGGGEPAFSQRPVTIKAPPVVVAEAAGQVPFSDPDRARRGHSAQQLRAPARLAADGRSFRGLCDRRGFLGRSDLGARRPQDLAAGRRRGALRR